MKLYIKQKVFSWKDKFFVKDADGHDRYYVEGEFLSLGKKLHVYDMNGQEVAYIEQELMTVLPKFYVSIPGRETVTVRQKFAWFHPKYELDGVDWTVEGSFWMHDYEILEQGMPVVSISKEWMTWGDSYELDITSPADELLALAVVLVIDFVIDSSSTEN